MYIGWKIISRGKLKENGKQMNAPCNPSQCLEVMIDQLENTIDFLEVGGNLCFPKK